MTETEVQPSTIDTNDNVRWKHKIKDLATLTALCGYKARRLIPNDQLHLYRACPDCMRLFNGGRE